MLIKKMQLEKKLKCSVRELLPLTPLAFAWTGTGWGDPDEPLGRQDN